MIFDLCSDSCFSGLTERQTRLTWWCFFEGMWTELAAVVMAEKLAKVDVVMIFLGKFDHDLNQRPKPIDDG